MSKYASGKRAYGISDRSGFRYRYKDLRKENMSEETPQTQSPTENVLKLSNTY